MSEKTNYVRSCVKHLKNESVLTTPKAPEKRFSPEGRSRRYFTEPFEVKVSKTIEKTNRFQEAVVFNCFYIMETILASKLQQQIKNISRKTKTNPPEVLSFS